MKHFAQILALGAAMMVAAPLAHADSIVGSVGFGGNGAYNGSTFLPGATVGATGSNAYVNAPGTGTLSAFTFLTPTNFSAFSTSTIPAAGELVFTSTVGATTVSFTLTGVSVVSTDAPGAGFVGSGILHETGYSDTVGTFTLNTNSGAGTFVTFSTATAAATPEPSSLIMLGTGLVSAAGMLVRRRRIV